MTLSRLIVPLFVLFAANAGAAAPSPEQEIRGTTEKLQALIRQNGAAYKADSAKFYAMVDSVIVPHFDTRGIGQMVLGRHWKDATPTQRDRFVNAFKSSLVNYYADALLKYADSTKGEWKTTRVAPEATEAMVNVDMVRPNGPPIPIGFSVKLLDGAWKVDDVVVEGVSLATSFRAQFNEEIKQKGLDALIARLEAGGKPLAETALEKPKG